MRFRFTRMYGVIIAWILLSRKWIKSCVYNIITAVKYKRYSKLILQKANYAYPNYLLEVYSVVWLLLLLEV